MNEIDSSAVSEEESARHEKADNEKPWNQAKLTNLPISQLA
jgi:hypothetical protein